jgi:hypothetical protein
MQIIGKMTLSGTMTLNPPPCIPYPPIMGNVSYSINNTGNANTFANVTFTPQYDGGAGVLCYSVVSNTGIVANALTTTITVNGLTKGNTYTFTAYATNGQGRSAPSNISLAVTPVTVPGAPTIVTANATSFSSANVVFTAPTDNGGNTIISYTATSNTSITSNLIQSGSGVVVIGGLSGSSSYTFTVSATNSLGAGLSSSISNTITTPATPSYAWVWGSNSYGQLGLGNQTSYSSPKQLGTLANWKNISTGGRCQIFATKTDNTLWSWGCNSACRGRGVLGLGDTNPRSSPVQIGALTNWVTVTTKNWAAAAIKSDGTLWTWGYNSAGQLGNGNITNISSPIQIGSCTNWKAVNPGDFHMIGLKTDGTLWAWGSNDQGQLGLGNTAKYSSPKQIGSITTWTAIGTNGLGSYAIKTDGTLWSWGQGFYGANGVGNTNYYSSPKQVGALTTWKSLYGGGYSVSALKTDNTLWAWGRNNEGALGVGDANSRSSPTQVGALTTWLTIAAGRYFNTAITSDGKLWAWGCNSGGQLGQCNTTSISSPKQVGSLTSWTNMGTSWFEILAEKTS